MTTKKLNWLQKQYYKVILGTYRKCCKILGIEDEKEAQMLSSIKLESIDILQFTKTSDLTRFEEILAAHEFGLGSIVTLKQCIDPSKLTLQNIADNAARIDSLETIHNQLLDEFVDKLRPHLSKLVIVQRDTNQRIGVDRLIMRLQMVKPQGHEAS